MPTFKEAKYADRLAALRNGFPMPPHWRLMFPHGVPEEPKEAAPAAPQSPQPSAQAKAGPKVAKPRKARGKRA